MRRWPPWLAGVVVACAAASCGRDEAPEVRLAFQQHTLACSVADLHARVQISGVDAPCMLQVGADRTVRGLCPAVPTGDVRVFRLVYFVVRSDKDVELATLVESLDLRKETKSVVELVFSSERLVTAFDDDNDLVTNLVEVCAGRNPLIAGE